ncbi:MAG: response regulator [Candidatus Omnitrophica bacterium]|nr:response regulator [Candidatus Omnitrophota bacterium]
MIENIIKRIKAWLVPIKDKVVLLIDDSDIDRRVAASILERRYHVLTAASGIEGLKVAREKLPDLILLDFMMPDMQGPDVCRVLKEDETTRHIPVIFLTSMDTPATVIDSFEEGAEIYLTKPISRFELVNQVRATLELSCSKGGLC